MGVCSHLPPCNFRLVLLAQERDESVQRVLWVDLLNLLALEGASGERVRAMLDASGAPAFCEFV